MENILGPAENIAISAVEFKDLKEKYLAAKCQQEDSFIWQEREVLTSFAKYLIMHLENEFKKIIEPACDSIKK
jgi:hypothetical protein